MKTLCDLNISTSAGMAEQFAKLVEQLDPPVAT